ncbi:MAG: universal stress protein [Betaproteobacteria bacterium]|jgi:nucleotide-binding universal stress UspA family protein
MLKVLLPVDGSASAVRATQKLIDTLAWYKEPPTIDVVAVHLPVPRVPNMGAFVSKEMIEKYYEDECEAMLAPSRKLLDAAGVKYTAHRLVGQIAETIVDRAAQSGSDMIYMGTRGMSALANMALGSVTTRVLHLSHIPVVLIH